MMTKKKAFTIIELMLAMAFLGTMLVGIATLVMRITNIYQKGLALRSINSVGREVISDLTRTINASRVNIDINPKLPSDYSILQKDIDEARANYFIATSDNEGRQLGGVFCTGDYSYVWNTADTFRKVRANDDLQKKHYDATTINTALAEHAFVIKTDEGYTIPKFARFQDKDRHACAHSEKKVGDQVYYEPSTETDAGSIKPTSPYMFDLGAGSKLDKVTELIEDNESDLAMYNFTIFPATQHATTKQIFYSGMFILATYRGGVNIKSNGDFCEGSDSTNGTRDSVDSDEMTLNDFDYCAVNKFNFSARATGETGINKYGG